MTRGLSWLALGLLCIAGLLLAVDLLNIFIENRPGMRSFRDALDLIKIGGIERGLAAILPAGIQDELRVFFGWPAAAVIGLPALILWGATFRKTLGRTDLR